MNGGPDHEVPPLPRGTSVVAPWVHLLDVNVQGARPEQSRLMHLDRIAPRLSNLRSLPTIVSEEKAGVWRISSSKLPTTVDGVGLLVPAASDTLFGFHITP